MEAPGPGSEGAALLAACKVLGQEYQELIQGGWWPEGLAALKKVPQKALNNQYRHQVCRPPTVNYGLGETTAFRSPIIATPNGP